MSTPAHSSPPLRPPAEKSGAPNGPSATASRSAGGFAPAVVQQAVSHWVAQSQDGECADGNDGNGSPTEPRQADDLAAWRAEDPEHERAWQHLLSVSRRLDHLRAVVDSGPATRMDSVAGDGARLAPRRAALSALPGLKTREKTPTNRRRALLKTTLMVAGFGTTGWWLTEAVRQQADLHSAVGETRVATLDDGTRLVLDTNSAVQVRFSAMERRVVLLRGAVMIQTGHAPAYASQPFVLQTAQGALTPLGTRFSAREGDRHTRLDVFEGAVQVTPRDPVAAATATGGVVHAGQRMSFDATTLSAVVPLPAGADAWIDGMMVANGMTLGAFCDELARYRPGILRCDADVGALRLSGSYPLHDTDRVLATLPYILPVRVSHLTRFWTRIAARPA